jgi:hypothetical protein
MPPLFFILSFLDSSYVLYCFFFGSGVFGSRVSTVRLMAVYSKRPLSMQFNVKTSPIGDVRWRSKVLSKSIFKMIPKKHAKFLAGT